LFRRRHHIYIDTIGKQRALSLEVTCSFRLYLKIGRQVLTRIESTDYPRVTTIVFKQEYPITLTVGGLGQMSRRDVRCLPIMIYVSPFWPYFWINVFLARTLN